MGHDQRLRREIGNRIKQLRIAKQLTIKDLADLAGMSAGYLSEVERGGSALSAEKLAALAACLGSRLDYLLAGVTEPSHSMGETRIPAGLSEAASILQLSYVETTKLLAGKRSLVARRGTQQEDWTASDWIQFYKKVEPYL